MKKTILILIISISVLGISGCDFFKAKVETSPPPLAKVDITASPSAANKTPSASPGKITAKDYIKIGSDLYVETMVDLFGKPSSVEDEVASPDDIVEKLGNPVKNGGRWHFKQGIEIDVSRLNDAYYLLMDYIYITPDSKIRTSRNIGIDDTKESVLAAYKNEINTKQSNKNVIVAGRQSNGLSFMIKNNKVSSIYIGTGAFEDGGLSYKR